MMPSGVLIHGAFEAMHTLGEDLEEAVENRVPLFRIELLGQLHRALDVGEQHRHLLALAPSTRPSAGRCPQPNLHEMASPRV